MPEDEKVVQPVETKASEQAQVESKIEEPPKAEEPPEPKQFSEDAVKEMLTKAANEAAETAAKKTRGEIESKWQSIKDKEVSQFARQAKQEKRRADSNASILRNFAPQLQNQSPEMAQYLQNATIQEENRLLREQQLDIERETEEARVMKEWEDTMKSTVTGMGVDVNDPNIDWGKGEKTSLDATKKILASAAEIAKKNVPDIAKLKEEWKEEVLKEMRSRQDDINANERREEGVDSVVTGATGGSVSDADFVKKWGNYEIPMTKENLDRYNKIQNTY